MNAKLSLLIVSSALGATALAMPAGRYREEIRNPFRGQDYTLSRTLNLRTDGKAEIVSEYRGERPTVDRAVMAEFGGLMDEIRDHRLVRHSGTWRESAGMVTVNLNRLAAGEETVGVSSSFEFRVERDGLATLRQDSGDYGTRLLRLRLVEDWGGEPERDEPGRYRGDYGWGEVFKSDGGETLYSRRLRLGDNRSAELISEYSGARPKAGRGELEVFGDLFAEVAARRRIVHKGQWREDGSRIVVELTRVTGERFSEDIRSSFVFEPRGNELVASESDRSDYGSRGMRLRRDWSAPRLDERPTGTPYPGPTGVEMDVSGSGGGFVSREGGQARTVTSARLILRKDLRFELRLAAGGEMIVRGTYEMERDRSVKLSVDEAFGVRTAGAGEAVLGAKGVLAKVTLKGNERGRRFSVTFDAKPG